MVRKRSFQGWLANGRVLKVSSVASFVRVLGRGLCNAIGHGVLALALLSFANCQAQTALPGTALGTFAVTAVLSSNSCGSGLKPTNPRKFDAEMSLDGNTLYFREKGEEEVSAPLDSDNTAVCTSVENSAAPNDSSCTISLKSIATIELDSADSPKTSSGSFRFEYSAVGNHHCASQLSENGGVYDELPCAIEYSYTALKTE